MNTHVPRTIVVTVLNVDYHLLITKEEPISGGMRYTVAPLDKYGIYNANIPSTIDILSKELPVQGE